MQKEMQKIRQLAINIGDEFDAPIRAGDPGPLLANLIRVAFVVAGLIVLFLFVFAGIGMIAGAGQDNPEKAAKAKMAATYAAIGFVVVFTAYWIIRLLEVITGVTFVTNPNI